MKKKIKYILKKQLYKKHFLLFVFSSIFNKPYIFFKKIFRKMPDFGKIYASKKNHLIKKKILVCFLEN